MGVADRAPSGRVGHTYREEVAGRTLPRSPVDRARKFGWDFVKFQPRGEQLRRGVSDPSTGRRDIASKDRSSSTPPWRSSTTGEEVALVNPKALQTRLSRSEIVARELGEGVPVIQTRSARSTVAGYLVGKIEIARWCASCASTPELVRPALGQDRRGSG